MRHLDTVRAYYIETRMRFHSRHYMLIPIQPKWIYILSHNRVCTECVEFILANSHLSKWPRYFKQSTASRNTGDITNLQVVSISIFNRQTYRRYTRICRNQKDIEMKKKIDKLYI